MDVLSNIGTSKVLYEIINGSRSPQQIAKNLKIKPPSVIEQIRRLEEIKIIKLGEKKGKYQFYEVDWQNLIKNFTNRATDSISLIFYTEFITKRIEKSGRIIEPSESAKVDEKLAKQERMFIEKLEKNKYFQRLITSYFKNLADINSDIEYHARGSGSGMPVMDAIRSFEEYLIINYISYKKKLKKIADNEAKEFVKLMDKWYKTLRDMKALADMALEDSFRDLFK